MINYYILYNPLSHSGTGIKEANMLQKQLGDRIALVDVTKVDDYKEFLQSLDKDGKIIVCGGDGTLNHFANHVDGLDVQHQVFFYPGGTGNDFFRDVTGSKEPRLVEVTQHIKNLPTVYFNGQQRKFINGIGIGFDGWVCDAVNNKKINNKKGNYTLEAVRGLLGAYTPCGATIIIDGKEYRYEKVWLAPTMKGRYLGGGMMLTPGQDRTNNKVTFMMFHDSNRVQTMMAFLKVFKGKHVGNPHAFFAECNEVTVIWDRTATIQIDGETFHDVTEYTVKM